MHRTMKAAVAALACAFVTAPALAQEGTLDPARFPRNGNQHVGTMRSSGTQQAVQR